MANTKQVDIVFKASGNAAAYLEDLRRRTVALTQAHQQYLASLASRPAVRMAPTPMRPSGATPLRMGAPGGTASPMRLPVTKTAAPLFGGNDTAWQGLGGPRPKIEDDKDPWRQSWAEWQKSRVPKEMTDYEKLLREQNKNLGDVNKRTQDLAKGESGLSKILGQFGMGGLGKAAEGLMGGGGEAGAAMAVGAVFAVIEKVAKKITDTEKQLFAYGRQGADKLNPRGAATVEASKDLFQMSVGKPFLMWQRAEANAYQKAADVADNFEEKRENFLNRYLQGGLLHGRGFRALPFGESISRLFSDAPRFQTGMGESQRFNNIAEWHASMTQQNLSMGGADRETWRKQLEASFDMWNRLRSGTGLLSDDDTALQVLMQLNQTADGLKSILNEFKDWLKNKLGG